jgi:hypothetical protein
VDVPVEKIVVQDRAVPVEKLVDKVVERAVVQEVPVDKIVLQDRPVYVDKVQIIAVRALHCFVLWQLQTRDCRRYTCISILCGIRVRVGAASGTVSSESSHRVTPDL